MPKIFFVRHCQSVSNSKFILAGRLPFPLTQKGFDHAKQVAIFFQKQISTLHSIYVSPQLRTQQTAQPFAEIFSLIPILDERLQEQDWGKFSGKTYTELEKDPSFQHPKNRNWNFSPENGESYHDVFLRVTSFFQDMYKFPDDQVILCVTHGGTLRVIRALLHNTVPEYEPEVAKNGEIWQILSLFRPPYIHDIIILE